jgi:osmotically-inducible protein OsmY
MSNVNICKVSAYSVALCLVLSGCATNGKCRSEGCVADAMITSNIEPAFAQHSNLIAPNSIEVRTVNHVAYLSGATSDGLMPVRAESIASKVFGVTRVVDDIYVPR